MHAATAAKQRNLGIRHTYHVPLVCSGPHQHTLLKYFVAQHDYTTHQPLRYSPSNLTRILPRSSGARRQPRLSSAPVSRLPSRPHNALVSSSSRCAPTAAPAATAARGFLFLSVSTQRNKPSLSPCTDAASQPALSAVGVMQKQPPAVSWKTGG